MINHQAVEVKPDLVDTNPMGQTLEKTITIAVIDENAFALIAAKTNMIDRPLERDAQPPGHTILLPNTSQQGNSESQP